MEAQDSWGEPQGSRVPAAWGRTGLRSIAAGVVALTLGFGPACAGGFTNTHDGNQSGETSAAATAQAFAGGGGAKASSSGGSDAVGGSFGMSRAAAHAYAHAMDARAWSRTVSASFSSKHSITSMTKSFSFAFDDDGNQAVSKAMARATAPTDVAKVQGGAGRVFARTSVDVTGNGAGTADAGGSIGITDGHVKVSTWGETSAEVF